MSGLLVVAGEASGDDLAAAVVRRIGVPAFGYGGPALAAAGARVGGRLDSAAMGLADPLRRVAALASALARVAREVGRAPPRAALLVGMSEPNARLAPWLRRRGVRVLWYAPPQIWAWRANRAPGIRRSVDRLAVVLPFERDLWRSHGADAHYVGHVALGRRASRADARSVTELASDATAVALLPGSRAGEVRRLLPVLLQAASRLAPRGIVTRALLAPHLDRRVRSEARDLARAHGVECCVGLEALRAFDVALTCSGTATLECAAAGVPPVVVYRTDALTGFVARRLLTTPHVALPNVLLGRRAFPELLLGEVRADRVATAALTALAHRTALLHACREVRQALEAGAPPQGAPLAVARLLEPWLD